MNDGKICVSVCAEDADELKRQIERATAVADVVEVRVDCLKSVEPDELRAVLAEFRGSFGGKLLATFRPSNGGQGGRREMSRKERIGFWRSFEGAADWADIEFDLDFPEGRRNIRAGFERLIWSFHEFDAVPAEINLEPVYQKLKLLTLDEWIDRPPDVLKIAVRTEDITDSIPIWKLLKRSAAEGRPLIPIAMGETGKWTRILGGAHGAFMTYAALDSGRETAPGQISAGDLREVYRVGELDADTAVYGIIGGNTSYSMSPYIHNAAFRANGLNAVFVPLQVADLDAFVGRMVRRETREVELNFRAFAVTIPHKESIIRHLDEIDETARKIGAVNTVKIVGDKLVGYNTDADGFIKPLRNAFGDLKSSGVAVFGSGGAARACVYALVTEGATVTIFARNTAKAKQLAEEFGARIAVPGSRSGSFDIVVNTTPLGTTGTLEDLSAAAADILRDARLAYDLVYNPFETRFLREAKAAGLKTVGGFEMLIAQAARQQEIWTGLAAPAEEMRGAALKRLQP